MGVDKLLDCLWILLSKGLGAGDNGGLTDLRTKHLLVGLRIGGVHQDVGIWHGGQQGVLVVDIDEGPIDGALAQGDDGGVVLHVDEAHVVFAQARSLEHGQDKGCLLYTSRCV